MTEESEGKLSLWILLLKTKNWGGFFFTKWHNKNFFWNKKFKFWEKIHSNFCNPFITCCCRTFIFEIPKVHTIRLQKKDSKFFWGSFLKKEWRILLFFRPNETLRRLNWLWFFLWCLTFLKCFHSKKRIFENSPINRKIKFFCLKFTTILLGK